jgi:heme/copper-type cytochrome/quinol oxidase subunit 4
MVHGFSKVSYVSVSVRVWWLSMERRTLSIATSVGLVIQASWWLGIMLLGLPSLIQSNSSASRFVLGLILGVCLPCTVIPLWLAWAVWTRRQYNFLLGFGIIGGLLYFIAIYHIHVNPDVTYVGSPDMALAFISIVTALMLVLPACISVIYIFTTPSVPEDQWW